MRKINILKSMVVASLFVSSLPVAAQDALFAPESIMPLRLEAPISKLLSEARKLGADGEAQFPRHPVNLSYQNEQGLWIKLSAQVTVRGNTAIVDCDFPKLEIKFDDTPVWKTSPFGQDKTIKIGTHCGDSKKSFDHSEMGRLKSDVAPHTEAFLYRLASQLGINAPRARYARMSYTDTDKKTTIERNAFILETHGRLAKRLGAEKLEIDSSGDLPFDAKDVTKSELLPIYFFENLIGNTDYAFPLPLLTGQYFHAAGQSGTAPYWNLKVLKNSKPGPKYTVVPYDFDLAVPVAMASFNFSAEQIAQLDGFVKFSSDRARSSWHILQQLRAFFKMDMLSDGQKTLIARKSLIYNYVQSSPISDESKKALTQHFDGFYEALNHLFDATLITNTDSWYNDDLMGDESQCLIQVIPPMPARVIGQGKNKLVKMDVIDVFQALRDASSWQFCKVPGYVSDATTLSFSIPEIAPPVVPQDQPTTGESEVNTSSAND